MHEIFKEDALMIARNILSGVNACGTLRKAVEAGDTKYFAAAAEAVLKVKREEAEHLRSQRDKALREAGKHRFALELLLQNLVPVRDVPGGMTMIMTGNVKTIVEKTLGRALRWDSG